MQKHINKDDFFQIAVKLIGEQKLGEAINYLQEILEKDKKMKRHWLSWNKLIKLWNTKTWIFLDQQILIRIPGLNELTLIVIT